MIASIPPAIVTEIEVYTSSALKTFSPASGGCINNGGKITTSTGVFFLKWNDRETFPEMLATEARGLGVLREASALSIPDVIHAGTAGEFQFLLMDYIHEGAKTQTYWRDFGSGLALLHSNSSEDFGLDHDNYIGCLQQINKQSASWVEFFIQQRLTVQLQIGRKHRKIDSPLLKKFEALFAKLPSLLPDEPPSLVHGDLWSGNLMTTSEGYPCLIDPAVYYGNREVDLAMTQLFGGFDPSYFDSYNETYPLLPGYKARLDLYNLYPLLVHVNLFGGGYQSQVVRVLNKFL